jgi:hypothetical protein
MKIEPQQEHQWLQQLVGEWTYEAKAMMAPSQPPSKFEGSESVRALGGLWILAEGQGEMPGCGAATTVLDEVVMMAMALSRCFHNRRDDKPVGYLS